MEWTQSVHGNVYDNLNGNHKQSILSKTFLNNCNSPLAGLFKILPHLFWDHIARYTEKKRKPFQQQECTTGEKRHNQRWFKKPIRVNRVVMYIGLLLLNMLHPHAGGLSKQWQDNGTLMQPPGRFGIVMCCDKFKVISRYLCMHDIDQDYGDDRHYQLHYIIQVKLPAWVLRFF
jgi:hypothetical protein